MILLLSPAKTLDMTPVDLPTTSPRLLSHSKKLVTQLKKLSADQLGSLMSISDKLADLNHERYRTFRKTTNGKPAIMAFKGDVYIDLEAGTFTPKELEFADRHIRILSGLYGLPRPMDEMKAYRLEMGTKLPTDRGNNLYDFWNTRITRLLKMDLEEEGSNLILNLASKEYYKSLQPDKLGAKILNVDFQEDRDGTLRFVSFNAKKARGRMANLIVKEGITSAEPLRELVVNDYVYREDLSTEYHWTYVRDVG